MIRVGQVTGAYGLAGAVKVLPLTDFQDRFDAGVSLLLDGCAHEVEWSREGQPGLVIKFRGIDNRTMAELFRGRYLELPDEETRELEEGRFYHRQVIGLAVIPANDVWVSREGSIEHLIPATKDAVVRVDLGAGRVVVADWIFAVEEARDKN